MVSFGRAFTHGKFCHGIPFFLVSVIFIIRLSKAMCHINYIELLKLGHLVIYSYHILKRFEKGEKNALGGGIDRSPI